MQFMEQEGFTSTKKGNTTNLFVFDDSVNQITLQSDNRKLLSVKNERGQTVAFQQTNGKITLKLDENNEGFLRVYKLTF
jgi:hypothetical protein